MITTPARTLDDPSAAAAAIEVRDLSKTYREGFIFRKKLAALQNVSFQVGLGEVFGLLGPNGAGKTTFLKILLGIIRKTSGQASMLSFPAGSRLGRRNVGYLPEQLRIPRHLNGYTALEYYGNLNNVPSATVREKRDPLLNFVGLAGRGTDRVTKYSKGMLQRLGLAQALLHDPQLLVMDEPTDGLDPRARAEMRDLMQDLRAQGVTIFLNSHLLQEVEMVCDRVAILDRGHLRYCGSVKEIGGFVSGVTGQRIQVCLELKGSEDDVMAAIRGDEGQESNATACEIVSCKANNELVQLVARFADQPTIDATIDRIREKSISLIRLSRETTSLEDAFLQITEPLNRDR